MTFKLLAALFVFSYGIMFLHLSVLSLAMRKKDAGHVIFAATIGVFGLLCIPGAAGIYIDMPGDALYMLSFVLMSLLAPLGTAYALEFLGDRRRRLFLIPVCALTGLAIAVGLILRVAGASWHKVICMAYAALIVSLGCVGVAELKDLDPYPALPRKLKIFFAVFWFIVAQLVMMLIFQFAELIPAVHFLWMVNNVSMLILSMVAIGNRDLYRQMGELANAVRYEKSRLGNVDVQRRLESLSEIMDKERLYAVPGLKISDAAIRIRMTGPQLSELLNRHLGQGFPTFINNFRISEAKRLLVSQPERSILDVAFDCGFSSKSTFNEVFQRQTGVSPSKFRERSPKS